MAAWRSCCFRRTFRTEADLYTAVLTERHRPTDAFEVKVIANMGRLGAQLERLHKLLVIDLQRTMDRAVLSWDRDREVYVDQLVEKLAPRCGRGAGPGAEQAGRGMVAAYLEVPGGGPRLYRTMDR